MAPVAKAVIQTVKDGEQCRTVLLDDNPAQEDAFGAHEQLARAIAELVISEPGGRAIGLAGSWGSGKSTVVQLLADLLRPKSGCAGEGCVTFVFDACIHEGDPLRRAFLEEMITFLCQRGWANLKEWEKDLDTLAKRKETTKTKRTPMLTLPGRLMAGAALFLPLGYALFGTLASRESPLKSQVLGFPLWIIGTIIVSAPMLIALCTWLAWRPSIRFWKAKFWKNRNDKSVLSLFVHEVDQEITSDTIKTPDPTTLEFRDIFRKLMSKVLGDRSGDRRLVLVIDNLDRAEAGTALGIWSTMRAFFEADGQGSGSEWMERFWLLVPFDPTAPERLLPDGKTAEQEQESGDAAEGKALSDAFLDKTFQVVFDVPPPVLTDWKGFLMGQLEKAFPDHHSGDSAKREAEFHSVYRLYNVEKVARERRPPTPRDVKTFVNKLGAVHRQRHDGISLPVQALYVLRVDALRKDPLNLATPDLIDPRTLAAIAEPEGGVRRNLAALVFGVEPNKAVQVLIENDVRECLTEGSTTRLVPHATLPGFVEVCEDVVEEDRASWSTTSPLCLLKAAYATAAVEEATDLDLGRIWMSLCASAENVTTWAGCQEADSAGLKHILERSPLGAQCAVKVLASFQRGLQQGGKLIAGDEEVAAWVRGVCTVIRFLKRAGSEGRVKKHLCIPGDPAFYIACMASISREKDAPSLAVHFAPSSDEAAVVASMAEAAVNAQLSERYSRVVDVMVRVPCDWGWHVLTDSILRRLQGGSIQPDEAVGCLRVLLRLACENRAEAKGALNYVVSAGLSVFAALDECQLSLLLVPALVPDLQEPAPATPDYGGALLAQFDQSHVESLVKSVADVTAEYGLADGLLQSYEVADGGAQEFISLVLRDIGTRADKRQQFTPTIVVRHGSAVCEVLNEAELSALISELVMQADLRNVLINAPFDPEMAEIYLESFEAEPQDPDKGFRCYRDYLVRSLRSLTSDDWCGHTDDGPLLDLLIVLSRRGVKLELGTPLSDALVAHAEDVRRRSKRPSKHLDEWHLVLAALERDTRVNLLRNIRDLLLSPGKKTYRGVAVLYLDALLDSRVLLEEADKVVRLLFDRIVKRGSAEELAWMDTVLSRQPGIVAGSRCKKTSRNMLADRLKGKVRKISDNDPALETLIRIAGRLKIALK